MTHSFLVWRNITGVLGEGNIDQQLACSKENKQFAATLDFALVSFSCAENRSSGGKSVLFLLEVRRI